MSIVVAMMFPDAGVVIYGDKRAVRRFGVNTVITDDYLKIHNITPTIICGITGHGEWGLLLISKIKESGITDAKKIIEFVKKFIESVPPDFHSTFTLGGIYSDRRSFLATFRTLGGTTFAQDNISYTIATNPEELGDICENYLIKRFTETNNAHQTLQEVVKFASMQNPETISSEFDVLTVPFKL